MSHPTKLPKLVKVKGLVPRELQHRYLACTPQEREQLEPQIRQQSGYMLQRMAAKGYRLEGTVFGIYGVFTRGEAAGTLRLERTQSPTPPPLPASATEDPA